jgi:metal-responsive CopG/Arc/MetJ family transcriptional regulator
MTKKSLKEFAQESKFSNDIFREVFLELISKYKHESERQHLIRAIIAIYEKKYRREMQEFAKIMDKKRELIANDFAADKEQRQRLVFKFPETLMNRFNLLVKDPAFLSQSNPMTKEEMDEWSWVIKNFPQFVVAKKI